MNRKNLNFAKYLKKSSFELQLPNAFLTPDKQQSNSQPIPNNHTERLQEHQTTKNGYFHHKRGDLSHYTSQLCIDICILVHQDAEPKNVDSI